MGHYVSIEEKRNTRRRKRQDKLDCRKRRGPLTSFNGSVIDLLRILPKNRQAVSRPDMVVTSTDGSREVSVRSASCDQETVDAAMARYGLGSASAREEYQRRLLKSLGR